MAVHFAVDFTKRVFPPKHKDKDLMQLYFKCKDTIYYFIIILKRFYLNILIMALIILASSIKSIFRNVTISSKIDINRPSSKRYFKSPDSKKSEICK